MLKINQAAEQKYLRILYAAVITYISAYFISSILRFNAFAYYDMDLAVYDQIIWNILQGSLDSSVLGLNFLGHHAHFLAFPVALIYKFFPHPLTLLLLQTLALGLGALPLYKIARYFLEARWSLLVALAYLLYPALGYTNFYEFHFPPFATLAILWMIYFFLKQQYVFFLISVIVVLLCQENLPLLIMGFGVYALILKRPLKWGLPLIIGGGAYLIFCAKFLLPALNKDTVSFISIYRHWGSSYHEIVINLITQPIDAFLYIFSIPHVIWLINLFGPLLFIPLLAPLHMLPIVLLFLQHLLSNRPQETSLYFHYAAELIPFIFLSFIYGLYKVLQTGIAQKFDRLLHMIVFSVILYCALSIGPVFNLFSKEVSIRSQGDVTKLAMLSQIKDQEALVTTFEFMPYVTHRPQLYSFHHIYDGRYTLSNRPYELLAEVDAALIDFNDRLTFGSFYKPQHYLNIQKFLTKQALMPVMVRDNMVLFKRHEPAKVRLFEVLNTKPEGMSDHEAMFSDGDVILKTMDIVKTNQTIKIDSMWYAKQKTGRDLMLRFDFIDNQGRLIDSLLSPVCYRIFPTLAWRSGSWVVEHKNLTIPDPLKEKSFSVRVTFYDWITHKKLKGGFIINL